MVNREDLQMELERILGSRNVYFQPPESVKINYPAIVYSRLRIDVNHADDTNYIMRKVYSITFITRESDSPVVYEILSLPRCVYDRRFVTDNLYHDVFTLTI